MTTLKPATYSMIAKFALRMVLLGLILIIAPARGAAGPDALPASKTNPPPSSPDPVKQEVEGLRQEVQALRAEILALKSLITANQPHATAESQGPSAVSATASEPEESEKSRATPFEVASTTAPPIPSALKPEPAPVPVPGTPTQAVVNSPKLFDGRITLGGYGSMRFETNNVSPGNNIPSGSGNGFTFRRFVLTTEAKVAPRLRIYSEVEFERLNEMEIEKRTQPALGGLNFQHEVEGNSSGAIEIEQMWGQYDFAENHGLRFGVVLAPLGRFNILHDDDYWDLPRRTLTDRDASITPLPAAWRELGAGLVGRFNLPRSAKLDYQFYVLNGTTLDFNPETSLATRAGDTTKLEYESELKLASGAFDGSQGAHAVAWRAALSPTLAGEIALSGYHGRYTPNYLSVHEPINSLGLDWKWRKRGFETEGEFIYTSLGRVNRVLENLAATALHSESEAEAGDVETETEVAVSGLARTRYGFWWDFKYHWRPEFLRKSFLGRAFDDPKLVPIARYERIWLNRQTEEVGFSNGVITDLVQQDLSQDRISLGVNFRPTNQFGFQLAYEHNRRLTGDRLIFPAVPDRSTDGFLAGMTFAF